MNTKALARHYPSLSPRERVPLIFAAVARGDEQEAQRLIDAAPRKLYRIVDYLDFSEAIRSLTLCSLIDLLDFAAHFHRTMGMLGEHAALFGEEAEAAARIDRLWQTARAFAYLFVAHLDGWRAFCAELHFDPDHLMGLIPTYTTVAELEPTARAASCTVDELKAFRGSDDAEREVMTAETVRRTLREALDTVCG